MQRLYDQRQYKMPIKLFNNKYRIDSTRLKNWDYGSNGAYFITICTKKRKRFFGQIGNNEMVLNEIGCIAYNFWLSIPKHFPSVELGNFQIMPNHTHGILIINKTSIINDEIDTLQNNDLDDEIETLHCNVSTTTTTTDKNQKMSKISPKAGTVSTIIRSYKSLVTNHARYIDPNFAWQDRFWDNIIRDSKSFERIQSYIEKNPETWKEDKFFIK